MAAVSVSQMPVNLFCFPYSGASAAMYSGWTRDFPAPVAVQPVELPGHGRRMREPLRTSLPALVEAAAETVQGSLDQPFALFGHSMGALLSFELARLLRQRYGRTPVHLFVSGHAAPHLPDPNPPIYNLPDAEFIGKVRAMNGASDSFYSNPELLEIFLPILRADFTVCETYQYTPAEPLDCPITALGGLLDTEAPRPALEAWSVHTRGTCRVSMFPGDHFYLNNRPPQLMEILARALIHRTP